jgi:hypothetical protein
MQAFVNEHGKDGATALVRLGDGIGRRALIDLFASNPDRAAIFAGRDFVTPESIAHWNRLPPERRGADVLRTMTDPGNPPADTRPPHWRHDSTRVGPKSLSREKNTVVDPTVDTAKDAEALLAGRGRRIGNQWVVNGRTYEIHHNRFVPVSGPGVHSLGRQGYQALAVYNEHGITPRAKQELDRRQIPEQARVEAQRVWRAAHPEARR